MKSKSVSRKNAKFRHLCKQLIINEKVFQANKNDLKNCRFKLKKYCFVTRKAMS